VELITQSVTPNQPDQALNPSGQAAEVLNAMQDGGVRAAAVIGKADLAPTSPGISLAPPLVSVLRTAVRKLYGRNAVARFPRIRLVARLSALDADSPEDEPVVVLRNALRETWDTRNGQADPKENILIAIMRGWPYPFALLGDAAAIGVSSQFWLWSRGIAWLGPECRWLRRQWKRLLPDETFETFLLGLTAGAAGQRAADSERVKRLAAQAFLEDLRVACQPRLWRRGTWNRYCRPVLILDNLDNVLPELLDEARTEAKERGDKPDPLLIVLVPRSRRQGQEHSFGPRVVHEIGDPRQVTYPRLRRPWLARAEWGGVPLGILGIPAAAVLLTASLTGSAAGPPVRATQGTPSAGASASAIPASVAGPPTAGCKLSSDPSASVQGKEWNAGPHDEECVGYSSTNALVFSNLYPYGSKEQQAQDQRVIFDEKQIFAEDAKADLIATQTGRTEVGLVYFAGITEGAAEDYDSSQGEELEGLLAAQMQANVLEGTSPLLKIVVANGGSKMQQAAYVAQLLLPLFASDSDMLGVVGLDRSTGDVRNAIMTFADHQIPVLATTLSADNFASIGKYYFSLSPANTAEATLILNYIAHTVTRYFAQPASSYYSAGQVIPTRVTVYVPPDTNASDSSDPDFYLNTLVNDLRKYAPGILNPATKFQVTDGHSQQALCGAATVDIYAGRHDRPADDKPGDLDDFGNFMEIINGCPEKPFVIGDDGVTRFVADPAARSEGLGGNWPISYVTKGLAILATGTDCLHESTANRMQGRLGELCGTYAQIATELRQHVPGVLLPWTGERVGLAYDAAELFLQAEDTAGSALARTAIPSEFEQITYVGVTGTVSFSPSDHVGTDSPDGMPLAIVRIALSNQAALPVCTVTSADAASSGVPSDTLPNPETCLDGQF
jgi:ABC-type branched-subunit amino acid transport system substrate-binding protein